MQWPVIAFQLTLTVGPQQLVIDLGEKSLFQFGGWSVVIAGRHLILRHVIVNAHPFHKGLRL